MLASLKAQHEADGTFPTKYDLTARFKGRGGEIVPATSVQTLADRLKKALKRFLQMKDLGMPVGFPRFKTATAGTRFNGANLRPAGMCGWTKAERICTCLPSWGGC
jgi:hypothetical protein